MNYLDFLTRVIDDGIAAATADYKDAPNKLEGAVAGFEACRGKSPTELQKLFEVSNDRAHRAYVLEHDLNNYWRERCYALEVEWVCNVVSATLLNQGLPLIITPTARGYMKAAEILGVAGALEN